MNETEKKLEILNQVLEIVKLGEEHLEDLPKIITMWQRYVTTPPCVFSVVFDPLTGRLRQVALSEVPMQPDTYTMLGHVATQVAQQFQNIAVEVAKNAVSHKEEVPGDMPAHS